MATRFDICGTRYKDKGEVVSKRGTEGKKKNDPPILALLRRLAGSRTAKIVQIFISTKNADSFRVGINRTSLFLHSPRTFFEMSNTAKENLS